MWKEPLMPLLCFAVGFFLFKWLCMAIHRFLRML